MFVVAEVALSVLLLVGAGLFVRSLRNAHAIDPGLDVDRLVSAPLQVNLLRYTTTQGRAFYEQVVERVGRVPGVESASVARVAMLGGGGRVLSLHVEGRAGTHDHVLSEGGDITSQSTTVTNANVIGPRFFQTVGIPLLHGRDFGAPTRRRRRRPSSSTRLRRASTSPTPIRSASGSASTGRPARGARSSVSSATARVDGSITDGGIPVVYLPLAQNHETGMGLYVRTSVPPGSLAGALRREIQQLEPNLPVPNLAAMAETVGTSPYAARMGIRLALGAGTRRVFLLVVRDGMWLVILGAIALLAAVAFVACAIPARRAIRVDPVTTLRQE